MRSTEYQCRHVLAHMFQPNISRMTLRKPQFVCRGNGVELTNQFNTMYTVYQVNEVVGRWILDNVFVSYAKREVLASVSLQRKSA